MTNIEFSSEWFSIENIDNESLNINDLKESDWFNIDADNKVKNEDNNLINEGFNFNSVTWSLTIRFKSVSLQNPATLVFTVPNWYKIIKGPNDIHPSKCPKTNPPVPCRRSITSFKNLEIEINSKIVCSWKDIFDRLNIEPLQIEVYEFSPFGEKKIHSVGFVNLKHILIQPEETKPEIINSYVYGQNSYRIWPTRVLLYKKIDKGMDNNNNNNNNIDYKTNIDSFDDNIDDNSIKGESDNSEGIPMGLIEIDIILEDCKKQPISESSVISKKINKNINNECNNSNTRRRLITNNSPKSEQRNKLKSASPPSLSKNKNYSPVKYEIQPQIMEDELELPFSENKTLNYNENMSVFDSEYISFNKISEFRPKLDLFNPGYDNLSKNILDSIKKEIKLNDDIDLSVFYNSDQEAEDAVRILNKWKLVEKERFIEHLRKLEDEFRKIIISRQEIIMKDFIENINNKAKKIGRLENLITEKIFKLKNKENSVDNMNNENNRKMQLLQYEHRKKLESQQNCYIAKLEIEKNKIKLMESEKNKWIKKYNDLENNLNKVFIELQNLKNSKKTELHYKSQLSHKDEIIKFKDTQINQLKDTVELLKASRDHIKKNFERLISSFGLANNCADIDNNNNNIDSTNCNIDSLIESGIYSENDEFIKYLRNN
ncbi:hypothetical protein FG386_001513 [Cryptosporidium ryanae]|uniref:uncharacterized protein n=1 Tax=Cryptosporidium ryanae TaxID=515981 RepID=UPI00351A76BF|nr:hypothetical protein FG386_001513 [Cryptosporidium ryanae]